MSTGKLITFEGVEGSGKSTLMTTLSSALEAVGHTVIRTREPGGTLAGERIRDVVLDPELPAMEPWAELFLMLAARAQVVSQVIRPALLRDELVLCDRYMDASTAYQGAGRELGIDTVERLNDVATGGLVPDLTFLVDVDVELGRSRLGEQRDRLEREEVDFHLRVRDGYLELSRRHPDRFCVLVGSAAPAPLAVSAWDRLGKLLPQLGSWPL